MSTISVSKMREFLTCEQRFKYRYVDNLIPTAYQKPLVVGMIFHSVLDKFYKSIMSGQVGSFNLVQTLDEIEATEVEKGMSVEIRQDFTNDIQMLKGMLTAYIAHYAVDVKKYTVLGSEVHLVKETPEFRFEGYVDLILKENETGHVFVVDHKTSSQMDPNLLKRLPLDLQVNGYIYLLEEHWGIKVRGIIYNIIIKSRKRLKKGQTKEQLADEIYTDYLLDPQKYFHREQLLITDNTRKHFMNILQNCNEDIERKKKDGKWKLNVYECDKYGLCPYLELCVMGDSARPLFKNAYGKS